MFAEIIGIGNDWDFGQPLYRENMRSVERELALLNIYIREQYMVPENCEELYEALNTALARSHIVFLVGGLGDTQEAVTYQVLRDGLSLRFAKDPESLKKLMAYYERLGKPAPKNANKMVSAPEGYPVFPNGRGLVPGCALQAKSQLMFLLPSQPDALFSMFTAHVFPYLVNFSLYIETTEEYYIYGPLEPDLLQAVRKFNDSDCEAVTLYRFPNRLPEGTLRILCCGDSLPEVRKQHEKLVASFGRYLRPYVFETSRTLLSQMAVDLCKKKNIRLAVAEHGTDGLLMQELRKLDEIRSVLEYDLDTRPVEIRQKVLGVPGNLLEEPGDKSMAAAVYMARGVREIDDVGIGLAVTGRLQGTDPVFVVASNGMDILIRECSPEGCTEDFSEEILKAAYSLVCRMAKAYPNTPAGSKKIEEVIKPKHRGFLAGYIQELKSDRGGFRKREGRHEG